MASASLDRFIDAQANVYQSALRELRAGVKHGHWMWFVFPQMRGLGLTETSQYFGISNSEEAQSYLRHPVLGQRLLECTRTVLSFKDRKLTDIFPAPDDLKFGSCMTLFALQEDAPPDFRSAIATFLNDQLDLRTVALLRSLSAP